MATSNDGALLVIVDGPNVVNDVSRWLAKQSDIAEDVRVRYLHEHFDVDRLVQATIHEHDVHVNPWADLGIVIVHSRKGVAVEPYTIEGHAEQTAFWARQGGSPSTSTMLVDIDGGPAKKEVGVDTTVVVYLFETAERWDAAILFSNDADYVPAVWALRRRGKRVSCSSHVDNRVTPLVAASQHFMPWSLRFLRADVVLFKMIQPDGEIGRFIRHRDIAPLRPVITTWGHDVVGVVVSDAKLNPDLLAQLTVDVTAADGGFGCNLSDTSTVLFPHGVDGHRWLAKGLARRLAT